MIKCIIFAGLLAVAFARRSFVQDPSTPQIVEMIKHYGYPVETYTVTTEDGYILDLFRIPQANSQRIPVLLMHGFMSSAEDFVVNRFALMLADKGYDVYLGNSRGSLYGRRHTTLDPQRDAAFWKFCFTEIGTRDLPAIIDKVLEVSQQDKLSYVGHMEGTTTFYVMGSERSEYLNKVDRMIALGPIVFMKHSTNILLKKIGEHMSKGWLIKNIGTNSLKFSDSLLEIVKHKCHNSNQHICNNPFFLINGYNSGQFNETIIDKILTRVPLGGSVREVLHFAQLVTSGHFQKFNENFDRELTKDYDLSKVTTPVALFYTAYDSLSNVDDVQKLIEELPSVYQIKPILSYVNNLDLVYGKHLDSVLYKDVVKCLEQDIPTVNFV